MNAGEGPSDHLQTIFLIGQMKNLRPRGGRGSPKSTQQVAEIFSGPELGSQVHASGLSRCLGHTGHYSLNIYCRPGTMFPIQLIYPKFKECLHCSRQWGYSHERDRYNPCPHRASRDSVRDRYSVRQSQVRYQIGQCKRK